MTESIRLFRGPFGHVSLLNVGGNLVTHAHQEVHIVLWLAGAAGTMTVGGRHVLPEPDLAIGINSFEPHNHVFGPDEVPGRFLAFYIDWHWLAARRGLRAGTPAFVAPLIRLEPWLVQAARCLPDRLAEGDDGMLAYEVERLIDNILDAADAARPDEANRNHRAASDFRIRKALALMEANVGERLCFDDVARAVGLSRPHFFALFKEQTGVTPNVYWNTLRIAEAMRCLRGSDDTMISVACTLGFTSQGNFSRFFREHTGVPPTVYREAANGGRPTAQRGGGVGLCR